MTPTERALLSLQGLSLGDAFGQTFFIGVDAVAAMVQTRRTHHEPWWLTDDSIMGCSVVETLAAHGGIDQDDLAQRFAEKFRQDMLRGYGAGAIRLLDAIAKGEDWREASANLFDGQGSFGNGSGMRVTPVGAYFAGDTDAVIEHARKSAEVTHFHPEGIAGAITVAVSAAWCWTERERTGDDLGTELLQHAHDHTPAGPIQEGLAKAIEIGTGANLNTAVAALGNGSRITAADTIPFVVWTTAAHLDDFEAGLWACVQALGDRDTTAAMVGGSLVLRHGTTCLPEEWLSRRESLAEWLTLPG